ncbi:uncharacterized protein J3D65DRAFT_75456 [Phyllosticta citribraziliensis]|uniref:Uncharacterized protein n=1 Tax=Phyllosticta citribraziliensis TaxID=989973 RepID=A0ABR1LD90_9PEZI
MRALLHAQQQLCRTHSEPLTSGPDAKSRMPARQSNNLLFLSHSAVPSCAILLFFHSLKKSRRLFHLCLYFVFVAPGRWCCSATCGSPTNPMLLQYSRNEASLGVRSSLAGGRGKGRSASTSCFCCCYLASSFLFRDPGQSSYTSLGMQRPGTRRQTTNRDQTWLQRCSPWAHLALYSTHCTAAGGGSGARKSCPNAPSSLHVTRR